jgi:hypothetical protein
MGGVKTSWWDYLRLFCHNFAHVNKKILGVLSSDFGDPSRFCDPSRFLISTRILENEPASDLPQYPIVLSVSVFDRLRAIVDDRAKFIIFQGFFW